MLLWDNTGQNSQETSADLATGWASFSRMLSAATVKVFIARGIEPVKSAKTIEITKTEADALPQVEPDAPEKDVLDRPITAVPVVHAPEDLDPVILPEPVPDPKPEIDYGIVQEATLDLETPMQLDIPLGTDPATILLPKPVMEVEQVVPKTDPVPVKPVAEAEPEVAPEPDPEPEPEVVVAPQPEPETEAEPEPEPEPQPEPKVEVDPILKVVDEALEDIAEPGILPPVIAFEDVEPAVEDVVTLADIPVPVKPTPVETPTEDVVAKEPDPVTPEAQPDVAPVPQPKVVVAVDPLPAEPAAETPVMEDIPAPLIIAEPKRVNFINRESDPLPRSPLPDPEPETAPDIAQELSSDPTPVPADFGDPTPRPADFGDPLPLPLSDRSGDYAAVGVEDPGMAMNASGYLKWDQYSQTPFIDRMKGAHAWSGVKGEHYVSEGDAYLTAETPLFKLGGQIVDVSFNDSTVIDIFRSLIPLDRAKSNEIYTTPSDYFRVSVDGLGNSVLQGRLDMADQWTTIVRFDQNLGMDVDALREAGHLTISYKDRFVDFYGLELDENGWPMELPSDLTGKEGSVATNVMWYPEETADAAIYSGTFYLMVEGTGTIGLTHAGTSSDDVANINKFEVDGPTRIAIDHVPDGNRVLLRIFETDTEDTGDYIKNIRIVHEDHLDAYLAGETFTPEYLEMMQDYRSIRSMEAVGGHHLHRDVEGAWEDRYSADYYTTNLGSGDTNWNGWPIEAIIELANKTGTDPWITVPLNASDDYVRGMAEYVKENLDPRLKVHVEYGNEQWNSAFESYKYARDMALDKWGLLEIRTDADGNYLRDASGDLIVDQMGWFVDRAEASANGYRMETLGAELGIPVTLKSTFDAWAEFNAMRSTEVGDIFEDVWGDDPTGQLSNVMGGFTGYQRADYVLMTAEFWKASDPDDWVDPASVFEGLAVGAYFGGDLASTQLDLLRHWISRYGEEGAKEMVFHQMKIGSDDTMDLHQFGKDTYIYHSQSVDPGRVVTDVSYSDDLVIDVFDAIAQNNTALRDAIRRGDGLSSGEEILFGDDVDNYVRLITQSGKTHLQIRLDTDETFETVLVFDEVINKTVDQMIDAGTLVVRRVVTLSDALEIQAGEERMGYAEEFGYDIMAYEGGQHFAAAVWGIYRQFLTDGKITDFLADLNEDGRIGELYELWNEGWADRGGELFAQFTDLSIHSRWGSFGVIEYLGQPDETNTGMAKLDAITEINREGAWWDEERVAGTFLQGVNLERGSADDYMTGTVEEDVLRGGDGDDTLDAGTGNDALVGGAGADLVLAGDGDDVVLVTDMNDTVDGGDGVDTVRIADMESVRLSMLSLDAVEIVDTTNGQADTLYIDAEDVLDISGTTALFVTGERGDTIMLDGFTHSGETEISGVDYDIFVGNDNGRSVALYVEDDLIG